MKLGVFSQDVVLVVSKPLRPEQESPAGSDRLETSASTRDDGGGSGGGTAGGPKTWLVLYCGANAKVEKVRIIGSHISCSRFWLLCVWAKVRDPLWHLFLPRERDMSTFAA